MNDLTGLMIGIAPDVPVERVVRFGRLKDEVRIEAEAFAADLVALAAPLLPGLWHRTLAWYLGRVALASKTPVVLLPVSAQGPQRSPRDVRLSRLLRMPHHPSASARTRTRLRTPRTGAQT